MPAGAVLVVDEAGQISSRQMLALLELVEARKGRIVLSGDTRQHGPVEASRQASRSSFRISNF
jgi:superfamily I DNA and/or RNA helicase